jgi:hypothetical protein
MEASSLWLYIIERGISYARIKSLLQKNVILLQVNSVPSHCSISCTTKKIDRCHQTYQWNALFSPTLPIWGSRPISSQGPAFTVNSITQPLEAFYLPSVFWFWFRLFIPSCFFRHERQSRSGGPKNSACLSSQYSPLSTMLPQCRILPKASSATEHCQQAETRVIWTHMMGEIELVRFAGVAV